MEPRRVKVDLHVHSRYSRDSLSPLEGIIKTCQRKGFDIICLTDHNTIEGALRLRDLSPLPVIVGEEIATTRGEIIAYFLEEWVPPGLSPADAIARVKAQGGVVSVSHPLDRLRREAMRRNNLMTIIDQVDALEIFNSRCLWPGFNRDAQALAEGRRLLGTAGSDAHTLVEIGCAYLEMPFFSSRDEFLHSLTQAEVHGRLSFPLVHLSSTFSKKVKRWTHNKK